MHVIRTASNQNPAVTDNDGDGNVDLLLPRQGLRLRYGIRH